MAVNQISFLSIGELLDQSAVFLECLKVALPVLGDDLGDREAVLGIGDRRCQVFADWELAETLVQREPGINRAGHRYRERSHEWNLIRRFHARLLVGGRDLGLHLRKIAALRRPAGTVVTVELVRLGIVDDDETVAADAIEHRLHQTENRVGRDRGIHRAAAFLKYFDGGERGQRLFGGGHAVLGEYRRACGPRCAGVTVATADTGVGIGHTGHAYDNSIAVQAGQYLKPIYHGKICMETFD